MALPEDRTSQAEGHYPGRSPIDAYGNGGFRFAEMSHRGSLLFLPGGVWAWEPRVPSDLQVAHFARVFDERENVGVLLLGTGAAHVFPSPEIKRSFEAAGIVLESMTTGAAARTYNILLAEQRRVGAALMAVD